VGRCYVVGDCEIRPDERRVLAGGKPAALGARAFDMLICLIERRDRVVTKDELMELVWPGSVVEENNLTVHMSSLRKVLGPQAVATIPGRGYRFTMDVAECDTGGREAPAAARIAEAVAAPAAARVAGDVELSLPDKPSIAVLPFDNLGGDPEQECFIDGIVEDIIIELSRFRSLFVIARNSSFSYKGQAVDVRRVASELGVQYVVEGSIRRAANRIRVTAQLIDATTGVQLWAERYDRALEHVFAVQEELALAIVAAIAPQIEAFEFRRVRGARLGNLNAYELAMRARDSARQADKEATAAAHDDALRLANEAVTIDPACGMALGTIAYLHWRQLWIGSATSETDAVRDGLAAARCALNVDGSDHAAHLWKGMLLLFSGEADAGMADLRRAHELNPNDALTLSLLGQHEAGAGDAQAGIRHATDALRLSPRDPLRWSFVNSLSWAYLAAGDYEKAVELAQRAVGDAPNFYPPRLCLVVSRIGRGEIAEAKAEFPALRDLAPRAVAARLDGRWNYADPRLVRRITTFLRVAAGLEPPKAAADALR
jgi:TolB-like protein